MVLVTSDDGRRPFKFAHALRENVRPQFFLATSDGAALFRYTNNGYAPVTDFPKLVLPSDAVRWGRDLFAAYLHAKPWTHVQSFPPDLHKAYHDFDVSRLHAEDWERLMTTPGAILERQSQLWRNQAGPMESWRREGTTSEAWFGFYGKDAEYTNLFVMGCPGADAIVAQYTEELEKCGLSISAAPRTMCIKPVDATKARAVWWLVGEDWGVSFGDQPDGNDASLRALKQPFIAVQNPEDTLQHLEELCNAANPQEVLKRWKEHGVQLG